MAGSPQKRARREAAAARAHTEPPIEPIARETKTPVIPDAISSRARARTPAHHARPLRPMPLGSSTRAASDSVQAGAMKALAQVLRPGIMIRIERTRPSWAAGFLEDYAIEPSRDAMRELLEHLRDEHGGQSYRLTAVGAADQVLYSGAMPVAGPVRDRGKPITRADWEESQRPAPAPARRENPIGELAPVLAIFAELFKSTSSSGAQAAEAVRELARTSQKQTADLTAAIAELRDRAPNPDAAPRGGMSDQLGELFESLRTLEQLKKSLGAGTPQAAAPKDDESPLAGLVKDVGAQFLTQVLANKMRRPNAGVTTVPRRALRPTPFGATPDSSAIPDAVAHRSGQPHPSN